MNADGTPEVVTWSAGGRGQAFLALDLNGNGVIDDGSELFGNGTSLVAEGIQAAHGFEALAQYDEGALGGNGNGQIDPADSVWSRLLLWMDVNHSGTSHPAEVMSLDRLGIVGLELGYEEVDDFDRYGNWHRYRGYFLKHTRVRGEVVVTRELMEDIIFRLIH